MISVLSLLFLFGGILVVMAIVQRGARRSRAKEPVCGGCGYSTVGLNALICPECGGDLRTVGILTPTTPVNHGAGFVTNFFILTMLVVALAVMIGGAMFSLVPQRAMFSHLTVLSSPAARQFKSVTISASGEWWEGIGGPRQFPILAEIERNGSADGQQNPPSTQLTTATFSQDEILNWMRGSGIDVTQPGVHEMAARVVAVARRIRRLESMPDQHGGFRQSSSGSVGNGTAAFINQSESDSRGAATPGFALLPIGLFWLGLWAAGVRYLWRSGRGG